MIIPLNEFEEIIDEVILARGLSYFERGYVIDFIEISGGEYEASVLGADEYTVKLKIENDVITDYFCDCPYDMGPVCKHVVASIFYLKQDELELSSKNIPRTKKKKSKSLTGQLNEILDKIPHKELKEFIQQHSKDNKRFRSLFLSHFSYLSEDQSKDFYIKQIEMLINSVSGSYGYIGWDDENKLEKGIEPLISNMENQLNNGKYRNAFYISTALMDEMIKTLNYSDDSNGIISWIIERSYEILHNIANQDLPDELRTDIFDYCITSFKKQLFHEWDWHTEIIEIAVLLSENEKEADIIIDCLNSIENNYEKDIAQLLILETLKKHKSEEQVKQFIKEHITNPGIRRMEIEKAIDNKNIGRAVKLCKDGIKHDKNLFGLVKEWYEFLLKIALIQNDKDDIIKYARQLFTDSNEFNENYYKILKQNIEPEKWDEFLEKIIQDIKSKGKWVSNEFLREIYIEEKWWNRLFELVKNDISLYNVKINEKYLAKDYSQELIQLYSKRLKKYVEINMGRSHYIEACSYLRRMKKLGGGDKVNELIEFFKKTYPRRRALKEELNMV